MERPDTRLLYQTDPIWVEKVHQNFPLFLADHAANERKAAASAMLLVVQYPDKPSLVSTAARIAEEEIEHFRLVFQKMQEMNAPLLPDEKDDYVNRLHTHIRSGGEERLLDRLLVHSVIEWRGLERFYLLAERFPDAAWRDFYKKLAQSEANHGASFYVEAREIFGEELARRRWKDFLEFESEACRLTPLTWKFH
jgi:tRNA 2-(methylsulfanyl)-N6-isopentenyladenosine37 hydroxylase